MMRIAIAAAALALTLTAPAAAQSAAPAAPACVPRLAGLGGIGRALVVPFTGPVFGAHVCATVANLSIEAFTARVVETPGSDALVTAALGGGGSESLPLEGATVTGVGPYLIAPGGVMATFGSDIAEQPRVVLAYAGQRVLVIATTPVALIDLARELRLHPGAYGADAAIERAVVLASGAGATLTLNTAEGVIGSPAVTTPRMLQLMKRG